MILATSIAIVIKLI